MAPKVAAPKLWLELDCRCGIQIQPGGDGNRLAGFRAMLARFKRGRPKKRIGERVRLLMNGAEPFVSFRHARFGRIGESGRMPSGWRSEHLQDVEIHDAGSRGPPWITFRMGFGGDIPGEYAGLGLASYLPAPKTASVALAAEVTLSELDNIGEVLLILREWREGGELLGQAARPLRIVDSPQRVSMSYDMTAEGGVTEPLLMLRRQTAGPGGLTVTFRGLAFGNVGDYPGWRFVTAGD